MHLCNEIFYANNVKQICDFMKKRGVSGCADPFKTAHISVTQQRFHFCPNIMFKFWTSCMLVWFESTTHVS